MSCPEPGCPYTEAADERDNPTPQRRVFKSTRSNRSPDARRDFDHFDIDEELARARLALKDGSPEALKFVAEAFDNIDEHLVRWGPLPKAWGRAKPFDWKPGPPQKDEDRMVGSPDA